MTSNTTGSNNTILGWNAIEKNNTGSNNVAVGCRALQNNTTGFSNVAVGCDTLKNNISGNFNSCFGNTADASGSFNSCFGFAADASEVSQSTCLGFKAVADISNVVILGNPSDALNKVGIGTSAPTEKLDVSGNVKIRNGHLDMSCNPIRDVSGIYFCDGSKFTTGNSLDISASTVHISGTNLIVDQIHPILCRQYHHAFDTRMMRQKYPFAVESVWRMLPSLLCMLLHTELHQQTL